jgi:uncharacterized protein (UPF0332 family)
MDEQQKLIQAYLNKSKAKLEVARELAITARYDDAISRAYYAMFYSAKAALLTINSQPRSHSGVVSQFSQHFVQTGLVEPTYGRMLSKAMQAREESDYDPIISAMSVEAEQIIVDAEIFVKKINELLGHSSSENP